MLTTLISWGVSFRTVLNPNLEAIMKVTLLCRCRPASVFEMPVALAATKEGQDRALCPVCDATVGTALISGQSVAKVNGDVTGAPVQSVQP